MKKINFLILGLLILVNLSGYSLLENQSGNYHQILEAKAMAMGNTGVSAEMDSPFLRVLNPGGFNFNEKRIRLDMSINGDYVLDKRTVPMYNSFEAYTDEATYASNQNVFFLSNLGCGYTYVMDKITLNTDLVFYQKTDFNSDYDEQIRNNGSSNNNSYPPIIAKNFIESDGAINSLAFNFNAVYMNKYSLGLMVEKLYGESDYEKRIEWSNYSASVIDSLEGFQTELHREFDAVSFKIGTMLKPHPRVTLGLSYSPKIDYDLEGYKDSLALDEAVQVYYSKQDSMGNYVPFDSTMYSEYNEPSRLRFGFTYKPRNFMKTKFRFDVEIVDWSDVNSLYDSELNYYTGIEHLIQNKLPFRFGFKYQTKYFLVEHEGAVFSQKVRMPGFTVGTGFDVLKNLSVNTAFEIQKRKYEFLDLFPDSFYDKSELWENYNYLNLQDRGWENPDTVKETFIKFLGSIQFRF